MNIRLITTIVSVILASFSAMAEDVRIVVAQDGSGDFTTVQQAVDAAPDFYRGGAITIVLKPGIYKEKLTVPASKQRIHLAGEDALTTVITWDDYALRERPAGNPMGTSATPTVFVFGDDFFAENITFENSAGEGRDIAQAVAIMVNADRAAFVGCRFLANQDTIYTYGKWQRQYYRDCYIEGTTDFIFGASTCWFENCTIHSKKDSYVTAASTPEGAEFGYVFKNCRLTHSEGVTKVYLGRPWRPFARTVFIGCELSDHILKEGWHDWNKPYAHDTVLYAEYGSYGPGSSDKAGRVSWSRILTPEEACGYVVAKVLDAGTEIDKNGVAVPVEWYYKVF
ncbi:MAG: pectinesterase family protein [Candidatus Cryptobacteroides sp.]